MSQPLSHVEKLVAKNISYINLYEGWNAEGIKFYAYISVPFTKMLDYLAACRNPPFRISDYGNVLLGGVGDVPEDVKKFMEEKAGVNHNLELYTSSMNGADAE